MFKFKCYGETVELDLFDDHIGEDIRKNRRFYEFDLLDYIKGLNLDGVYIDGGANIGNHSVFFAQFCKCDHVYSFEPLDQCFQKLLINTKRFEKVYPQRLALDFQAGHLKINNPPSDNMGSGSCMYNHHQGRSECVCTTINHITQENITLIKLDIEGMEYNALWGGINIIDAYRPIVIAECQQDSSRTSIDNLLHPYNYVRENRVFCGTPTYVWKPGLR